MITELPNQIRKLLVSDQVIAATRNQLDSYRKRSLEGCVLWYGYVLDEQTCIATTSVCPAQQNNKTNYAIPTESMRQVRQAVRPLGLLLLMQVHTHPKEAYFSEWDEQNALNKRAGALNMVVADYGNVQWIDAKRFCVVEMNGSSQWQEWSVSDWQRLQIVPHNFSANNR